MSSRPLDLQIFLNSLFIEANNIAAEKSINSPNAENSAMAADKKKKGSGKQKSDKNCTNCNKNGHTKECFVKGGGKEHEAPDWWKAKVAKKASGAGKDEPSANITKASDDIYTFLLNGLTDSQHPTNAKK